MALLSIVSGLAFLLGLLFGSFLNVCIVRLPLDESIVTPRSHCRSCGQTLRWFENIPLFSFLAVRRRCRHCTAGIGWQYPAVEFVTGLWFVACVIPVVQHAALSADALSRLAIHQLGNCVLGCLLICLAVIDWQHLVLPDSLTLTGLAAGLFFACAEAIFLGENEANVVLRRRININAANAGRSTGNIFLTGPEHLIYGRLLAAAGAFLILFLIGWAYKAVRKRDGMGLGDAKLLAMLASFLGFAPSVLALFLGTLLATLYAVVLLARRRAGAATRLPFGSFLAAGGLVAAAAGRPLLDWYMGMFP